MPLLCGLATLWLTRRLALELTSSERLATYTVLLLAFGTPITFYSLTFWEHTPAILLSTSSLFVLARGFKIPQGKHIYAIAGIFLGLSTILREEGYILLIAIGIGCLWTERPNISSCLAKKLIPLSTGFLIVAIPVWTFQLQQHGHILGIHAVVYDNLQNNRAISPFTFCLQKAKNFFVFLLRFHATTWLGAAVICPLLGSLITGITSIRLTDHIRLKTTLLCLTSGSCLILTGLLIQNPQPIIDTLNTQALITGCPLLIFFFASTGYWLKTPSTKTHTFCVSTALLFIIGTCLSLNTADTGIIWGPRHFLGILPILATLSVISADKWILTASISTIWKRIILTATALLVLASLIIQAHGIHNLFFKKQTSKNLIDTIAKGATGVILTDIFWLPEELAPLFPNRNILQLHKPNDLTNAADTLKKAGISHFELILSPHFRRISHNEIRQFVKAGKLTPGPVFTHPQAEYMTVQIFHCSL